MKLRVILAFVVLSGCSVSLTPQDKRMDLMQESLARKVDVQQVNPVLQQFDERLKKLEATKPK